MKTGKMYTTDAYAELYGLGVQEVRYHCKTGNLECTKIASAGHGIYLIPEGAKITRQKPGRKQGWRKKKDGLDETESN